MPQQRPVALHLHRVRAQQPYACTQTRPRTQLTTAERRRLAKSLRHSVARDVQRLYTREQQHKAAIADRQAAQEARAARHLQQLAQQRQEEVAELATAARQQSLLLRLPPLHEAEDADEAGAAAAAAPERWQQLQLQMGVQQQLNTAVHAAAAEAAADDAAGAGGHVAIDVPEPGGEIAPALPGQPWRVHPWRQQQAGDSGGLREPLLLDGSCSSPRAPLAGAGGGSALPQPHLLLQRFLGAAATQPGAAADADAAACAAATPHSGASGLHAASAPPSDSSVGSDAVSSSAGPHSSCGGGWAPGSWEAGTDGRLSLASTPVAAPAASAGAAAAAAVGSGGLQKQPAGGASPFAGLLMQPAAPQ